MPVHRAPGGHQAAGRFVVPSYPRPQIRPSLAAPMTRRLTPPDPVEIGQLIRLGSCGVRLGPQRPGPVRISVRGYYRAADASRVRRAAVRALLDRPEAHADLA